MVVVDVYFAHDLAFAAGMMLLLMVVMMMMIVLGRWRMMVVVDFLLMGSRMPMIMMSMTMAMMSSLHFFQPTDCIQKGDSGTKKDELRQSKFHRGLFF
mmetsp:Transcript_17694/g.50445  ORF Transcript_17694/g.50445 Transcript_17694/m.50445 type:complete len:98 (-) Transcript_17694:46-339(-)